MIFRARLDELHRLYLLGRYGVISTFRDGQWQPIPSLPDFEGVTPDGRQFIFDVKVCSQPAYDMTGGTSKSFKRQYLHMQRRAKFGVKCFLLIHFNERTLKTKTDEPFTVLFPILDNVFWQGYDRGEQKKISRQEARMYGIPVNWDTATDRGTRLTPNLLEAITKMEDYEFNE